MTEAYAAKPKQALISACSLALFGLCGAYACSSSQAVDAGTSDADHSAQVAQTAASSPRPTSDASLAAAAQGGRQSARLQQMAGCSGTCPFSRDAAVGSTSEEDAGAAVSGDAPTRTDEPARSRTDRSWVPGKPKILGMLAGFEARYANDGANVYGSDMASSFVHAGKVVVLFGDTFKARDSACDTTLGENDDMVGTLPLEYNGELPLLEVVSEPSSPPRFRPVQMFDGDDSILMDEFKVPMTGFSDGESAYALLQAQIPLTCDAKAPEGEQGCPEQTGVRCVPDISLCEPAPVSTPTVCEAGKPLCILGGCKRSAVCVDTRSSQFDGSPRGNAASMMSTVFIGKARADDLATYDVVSRWKTNVFSHASVRTVTRFSGELSGSDYSVGKGDLLIWGRPAMHAEQGREARLYFATLKLPLQEGGELRPRYFAGSDPATGEPSWSDEPEAAEALSMDGTPNGDSHERQAVVSLTTVSWLPEPINQWVMMYGGDLPDVLLADASGTRSTPNAGSIVMRFAKDPWGPWSPPIAHLPAGSAQVEGDAYGPGGILFNSACMDTPNARCARSDPYSLQITGQCAMRPAPDPGRLYAPAIVDAYTRKNERGGLNIVWAISTWMPYAAFLMETSIDPG